MTQSLVITTVKSIISTVISFILIADVKGHLDSQCTNQHLSIDEGHHMAQVPWLTQLAMHTSSRATCGKAPAGEGGVEERTQCQTRRAEAHEMTKYRQHLSSIQTM